ncbi:MAG: TrmH family RNA methyltransferase [bacterium]
MLTKAQIKRITSLKQKKFRQQYQCFVAEGRKTIEELLDSKYALQSFFGPENYFDLDEDRFNEVKVADLKRISFLKNNAFGVAVFSIPKDKQPSNKGLIIALDAIQDPGNLGTIIRLCDWFGVSELVCGLNSVDCYNPKVVQATMGSLARVNVSYLDLIEYTKSYNGSVFGTFMDGDNIYSSALPKDALIIFGNEANGISADLASEISHTLSIPRFGSLKATESLNVANATAIVLSEFRRNLIEK